MPTTYTPIATQTADGSTIFFDFSSIPQTYTDLILVISGSTGDSAPFIRLNSNTSPIYSSTSLQGNGTSATSSRRLRADGAPNDTRFEIGLGSSNEIVTNIFNIMNYTNTTTNKTVLCRANQAGVAVKLSVGLYGSTSAINAIRVGNTNSNALSSGTVLSLYGIASAAVVSGAKATGGDTIATDGTYWYHAFRSSGTFTPSQALSCGYLVVAGGGGSGDISNGAGGGAGGLRSTVTATGGGGSLESAISLASGTSYTITVGAGGAGTVNGNNSSIAGSGLTTITSVGGGKGGNGGAGSAGGNGGSGGGVYSASFSAGTGTANQGYGGGGPTTAAPNYYAGGGGGAGAAGSLPNGGNGVQITAFATPTGTGANGGYYAGGGAGGADAGTRGTGGLGGGGTGGLPQATGSTAGTANTGGGGGGYVQSGGSGIVIVRYPV